MGKLLFFEPALSGNGKRSCASCHRPEKAFTDHRGTSRALRFTANLTRNSPTLLASARQKTFFHDGRAANLGEVVRQVVENPQELGSSYAQLTGRLAESPAYRLAFRQALGTDITEASVNKALAAYVTSLISNNAAYDQARRGQQPLPTIALAGKRLFMGPAGCVGCHAAPDFRDGRRYLVRPGEWVKTPTLRNVALTPPYGANGQAATLLDVLGDAFHAAHRPRPLAPAEASQLLAFLAALTDTTSAEHRPPLALPALHSLPDRRVGGLY
ncbi:cytochrome-c peroxidase [Hymenobacter psoromatis]|uniref:cytochrome-c peroxidase n=1 Tax=Hymenobacter psoromatis TaxID=1484116 RepID=UPI0021D3FA6A|nr:cytochrome c peroxidase [Hymenobacter psoromatis]